MMSGRQSSEKKTREPGWSDKVSSPEIQAYIRKNRKVALIFTWILFFLFPLGFFLAGLFARDLSMGESLIIGFGLGLLMLAIGLLRVKGMEKTGWEGVVTEKFAREREDKNEDAYSSYTEYTVRIKTNEGKTRRIVEKGHRKIMYDYLSVGDRVRYHPALSTYEKWDTTKDTIIYCNVCQMKNAIQNEFCTKCHCPLLK